MRQNRRRRSDQCAQARAEGIEVGGPYDTGPPVGYWAIIPDPDGHNLELSYGQGSVGFPRALRRPVSVADLTLLSGP